MSEERREGMKKDVPQIDTVSGVSGDYVNAYTLISSLNFSAPEALEWFLEDAADPLARGYLVQKYTDRFSPTVYQGVVSPNNQDVVSRLDDFADQINAQFFLKVKPIIESGVTDEGKKVVLDFLAFGKKIFSRVERLIAGEIIPLREEAEDPLSEAYLMELSDILSAEEEHLSLNDWADRVSAISQQRGGILLHRYRESAPFPVDEARQKRIERINALVDSINADFRNPDVQRALSSKQALTLSITRKLSVPRIRIIDRMARGTSGIT